MYFLIYSDKGVSSLSVHHSYIMLKQFDIEEAKIKLINADYILEGLSSKNDKLLIMPGGADTFYMEKLGQAGNFKIKDYVIKGGGYLGFCAGAYFACKSIQSAIGTLNAVSGKRKLGFYPGNIIGPTLAPYSYNTKKGFKVSRIKFQQGLKKNQILNLFYHGGGTFMKAQEFRNINILAEYTNQDRNDKAVIIQSDFGKGKVVLSGVHFEIDPYILHEYEYSAESLRLLRSSDINRRQFIDEILKEFLG